MILAEQYLRFRRDARAFAHEVIEPRATMHDLSGEFVKDNVQALMERGWLGIPWPKELGGMGLDYQSYVIAVEEVSRVCASTGLTMAAHT
jgi:alkylation response protein AidB-like acyl-CoA dehydrogenase